MPAKGSGVTSIAKLRKRCHVDRKTGCWHWTGAMNGTGTEARIWLLNPATGKRETMSGAKAVAILSKLETPQGGRAWMECGCDVCVCPAHVKTGTTADWGAWVRDKALWVGSAARKLAATVSARARGKLTIEIARAIRSSDELGTVEALRYGVHPEQVSRVRLHKAWCEPNPFAGLGAR